MPREKLALIILGVVISGTTFSINSYAQEDELIINSSSYEIIPRLMTPSINPGEQIKIDMYISGYGPVKQHKNFFELFKY